MERRFHHDFSAVRVHSDERSAAAASQLSAAAFTMGRDIFFGASRYAPHSGTGLGLLAHELSHALGPPAASKLALNRNTHVENAADRIAHAVETGTNVPHDALGIVRRAPAAVYRKMAVDKPDEKPALAPKGVTNATIVNGYVKELCSAFHVTAKGQVVPTSETFCAKETKDKGSTSCGCPCTLHAAAKKWTIKIDDEAGWPVTSGDDRTVRVPSPYFPAQFGAWSVADKPEAKTGSQPGGGTHQNDSTQTAKKPAVEKPAKSHRVTMPNWLVFAHELCGHAVAMQANKAKSEAHGPGGTRTQHWDAVDVQNEIAEEHGTPASEFRGQAPRAAHDGKPLTSGDPHGGESWARFAFTGFSSGSLPSAAVSAQKTTLDVVVKLLKEKVPNHPPASADVIGHAAPETATGASTDTSAVDWNAVSKTRAEAVTAALISALKAEKVGNRVGLTRGLGSAECDARKRAGLDCNGVDVYVYGYAAASVKNEPEGK